MCSVACSIIKKFRNGNELYFMPLRPPPPHRRSYHHVVDVKQSPSLSLNRLVVHIPRKQKRKEDRLILVLVHPRYLSNVHNMTPIVSFSLIERVIDENHRRSHSGTKTCRNCQKRMIFENHSF